MIRLRPILGFAIVLALPLAAQTPALTITGYAKGMAAGYDLGYDLPAVTRSSIFTGGVLRLQWGLELGSSLRIDLHEKIQGTWSDAAGGTQTLGFGVSAVPQRFVNLRTTITSGSHGSLTHDVDRLSATARVGPADVTVGRQPITWGLATVFPVTDLWTQFSPFELDTENKPGTDAVRALVYPSPQVELDMVMADRGAWRDLSAGARATVSLPAADVYVGGGKFWREVIGMGGVAAVVGEWKVRAEAAVPWNLDADSLMRPRITVGADRIGATVQLSVEYHYNGLGASNPASYQAVLASPAFARGETYYLGRHLAGAFASWAATDRLTVGLGSMVNLNDGSVAFLPSASRDIGQRYRLTAGGLLSLGSHPDFTFPGGLAINSEFGTYGRFGYVQGAFYF